MDSTIYLLSGDETCLKETPACAVVSVKLTLAGCWAATLKGKSETTANIPSRRIVPINKTKLLAAVY
jgi:hypothetical protein